MSRQVLLWIFLLSLVPVGWGADEARSVTLTVSKIVNVAPDQAVFAVDVVGGPDLTLTQAVAAIGGAGITAELLTGVQSLPVVGADGVSFAGLQLDYSFRLMVPADQLKAMLAALQATAAKAPMG